MRGRQLPTRQPRRPDRRGQPDHIPQPPPARPAPATMTRADPMPLPGRATADGPPPRHLPLRPHRRRCCPSPRRRFPFPPPGFPRPLSGTARLSRSPIAAGRVRVACCRYADNAPAGSGSALRRSDRMVTGGPVTPAGISALPRYALALDRCHQARGLLGLSVSAGRSGASEDAGVEQLRRRYPQWIIWRGGTTGDYWAMPPRGHPTQRVLISAPNRAELAQALANAEGQYDL